MRKKKKVIKVVKSVLYVNKNREEYYKSICQSSKFQALLKQFVVKPISLDSKEVFYDLKIPKLNIGFLIYDPRMMKDDVFDVFVKGFKMAYVFCIGGEKLNQISVKNPMVKLIIIKKIEDCFKYVIELDKIEKRRGKIKKIENDIHVLTASIQEFGKDIISKIPSIEEEHSDYIIQEVGSVQMLCNSNPQIIRQKTPLNNDQVNEIYRFFN